MENKGKDGEDSCQEWVGMLIHTLTYLLANAVDPGTERRHSEKMVKSKV